MNETCEVNIAPCANSPDDPRYRSCGGIARFKVGETWLCAEHYDEHCNERSKQISPDDDLEGL